MAYNFQTGRGDGREWKNQSKTLIIDYHDGPDYGMAYWELLKDFHKRTMEGLKKAQEEGYEYILFTHGSSTSRQGAQTARSEVRKIMISKKGTPYIIRKNCIDYGSAFLAAIRQKT
ncbi:MAG: hypothetical protein FWD47_11470 [Treponema sp.]|nr:hypothetical protein [Treponema sp.]